MQSINSNSQSLQSQQTALIANLAAVISTTAQLGTDFNAFTTALTAANATTVALNTQRAKDYPELLPLPTATVPTSDTDTVTTLPVVDYAPYSALDQEAITAYLHTLANQQSYFLKGFTAEQIAEQKNPVFSQHHGITPDSSDASTIPLASSSPGAMGLTSLTTGLDPAATDQAVGKQLFENAIRLSQLNIPASSAQNIAGQMQALGVSLLSKGSLAGISTGLSALNNTLPANQNSPTIDLALTLGLDASVLNSVQSPDTKAAIVQVLQSDPGLANLTPQQINTLADQLQASLTLSLYSAVGAQLVNQINPEQLPLFLAVLQNAVDPSSAALSSQANFSNLPELINQNPQGFQDALTNSYVLQGLTLDQATQLAAAIVKNVQAAASAGGGAPFTQQDFANAVQSAVQANPNIETALLTSGFVQQGLSQTQAGTLAAAIVKNLQSGESFLQAEQSALLANPASETALLANSFGQQGLTQVQAGQLASSVVNNLQAAAVASGAPLTQQDYAQAVQNALQANPAIQTAVLANGYMQQGLSQTQASQLATAVVQNLPAQTSSSAPLTQQDYATAEQSALAANPAIQTALLANGYVQQGLSQTQATQLATAVVQNLPAQTSSSAPLTQQDYATAEQSALAANPAIQTTLLANAYAQLGLTQNQAGQLASAVVQNLQADATSSSTPLTAQNYASAANTALNSALQANPEIALALASEINAPTDASASATQVALNSASLSLVVQQMKESVFDYLKPKLGFSLAQQFADSISNVLGNISYVNDANAKDYADDAKFFQNRKDTTAKVVDYADREYTIGISKALLNTLNTQQQTQIALDTTQSFQSFLKYPDRLDKFFDRFLDVGHKFFGIIYRTQPGSVSNYMDPDSSGILS